MTEITAKSFNHRAFVSVLVGISFVLMTITGLVLFFAPSCRIARDTSWSVLGYDKDQFVAVHVWFSLAFVIASVFHTYLNWKALINYFKSKVQKGFAFRVEWIAALVICGIVFAGTITEVPPFSSLMVWKETFKHEGDGGRFGRGRQGWAWENVSESGMTKPQVKVHGEQDQMQHREGGGFGMGQKTLKQFCEDEGIELPWAIARLKYKGFPAQETMTMREIAGRKGSHPRELREILRKGY